MNYVETVADLFLTRRGYTLLSVADYVTIAEWEKEEIPLDVVVISINESLDDFKENTIQINSIGYFQEIIRKNFAKSLQKRVAK